MSAAGPRQPPAIALVGMACRYPDAASPVELWENVLAQRRAFRRLPSERLNSEDYYSADPRDPDRTYSMTAALIEDYEFDRVAHRVSGSQYRSADLAHWLALDVAGLALADAGFPQAHGLPREATAVYLGNTLTGEFSRAAGLRLRWPFVRRVVSAALRASGVKVPGELLREIEDAYKRPFPETGEDTLAGGLSNTIAGRISNHFDLQGGGYTVDGACASSLLAVSTACSALSAGDCDAAVAGGVDLSLDPFELVGFAKAGALAAERMRVFDVRSAGFWPGEGCGFAVLMRHDDAVAAGRRIYALIRGWGISSDGSGGITRPKMEGQLLAFERAYRKAGFGPDAVAYFEGHGTGTAVGDATELGVIARAREALSARGQAAVGSVKGNIGHTKAAAGIAGMIKAAMALDTQVIPPATGCESPHPAMGKTLRAPVVPECWPADQPLRASVSAMGFGGINCHVVMEGAAGVRRTALSAREKLLGGSPRDAELFVFHSAERLRDVAELAAGLSLSEMSDLAASLARDAVSAGSARCAMVASTPEELARKLATAVPVEANPAPRIGFLFPGQGSQNSAAATQIAQPAIVRESLGALAELTALGIQASVAIGHSLGELTALSWADVMDPSAAIDLAAARGRLMAAVDGPEGAMAAIGAGEEETRRLIASDSVVVAGINSPRQTVVSGEVSAVQAVVERVRAAGKQAARLAVSHAFHSPLMAAAGEPWARHLATVPLGAPTRRMFSSITGAALAPEDDPRELLCRQMTAPVRFRAALEAAGDVDLWIEVGPGRVLAGLARDNRGVPVVSVESGSLSRVAFLDAVAAVFELGTSVRTAALFENRFTRPFRGRRKFFVNPCELAPADASEVGRTHAPGLQPLADRSHDRERVVSAPSSAPPGSSGADAQVRVPSDSEVGDREGTGQGVGAQRAPRPASLPHSLPGERPNASAVDVVRLLVAERAELPPSSLRGDSRLLADLHLNSIVVAQIAAEAARRLGISASGTPMDYAGLTLAELADALEASRSSPPETVPAIPSGIDSWVRAFHSRLAPRELPVRRSQAGGGDWRFFGPREGTLRAAVEEKQADLPGEGGVILCLPPYPDEHLAGEILAAAQAAVRLRQPARFVVVQHGGGAASVARTAYLEAHEIPVCVVDLPVDLTGAVELVIAEAAAARRYTEAHYDRAGVRFEPTLTLSNLPPSRIPPGPEDKLSCSHAGNDSHESDGLRALFSRLPEADVPLNGAPVEPCQRPTAYTALAPGPVFSGVLLVSGGGKGIGAECAIEAARATGVKLALVGSSAIDHPETAANLARMKALGLRAEYFRADVTDTAVVRRAFESARRALGPITGILHCAGINRPQSLEALDEKAFRQTLAVKQDGLRNLLGAADGGDLQLVVAFGSIIARMGMAGEADYALANEWMARDLEAWSAAHPQCRSLTLEWSVWAGAGMGVRVAKLEHLKRLGVSAISIEEGVRAFLDAMRSVPPGSTSLVMTGRFGTPPTLQFHAPELPLLRFLERTVVHYPGVELIAEADLSTANDPYLAEHVFSGAMLLPGVMAMEAMAQAAVAVSGARGRPAMEPVRFLRPVIVPESGPLTIRMLALVRAPGEVEVCLRSAETAFQADHFRATCRFAGQPADPSPREMLPTDPSSEPPTDPVALDPAKDLYGGLLFQEGRFRRLRSYQHLEATGCVAEAPAEEPRGWFNRYLPQTLILGDAGLRDAAIHAIQACIPHARVLPSGAAAIDFGAPAPGLCQIRASERSRQGDLLVYDLEIVGAGGDVLERWRGLELRIVDRAAQPGALGSRSADNPWPPALLAPYLERRVKEILPLSGISVLLVANGNNGRSHGILHRPDGKPLAVAGHVSRSRAGNLTMTVGGAQPVGCDCEAVAGRTPDLWRDLLGQDGFALAGLLARDLCEDLDRSCTRVWCALESVKKAGGRRDLALALSSPRGSMAEFDGWVVLRAGPASIATLVAPVAGFAGPLAFALMVGA